jgi:crotonobetainyl-CoA:carnitine CoA-transferase CaiB-like acyl-CoA transferase
LSASPLSGLLVVDLSRLLPGPLAARLLADLGARVVKVEEPSQGDPVRSAPPRSGGSGAIGGTGALAALLLGGLESVALNLKQPAGLAVLRRLLTEADVLLESFRPGTLARVGLSPDELRDRFPRLVHCSLTGWGVDGPYARRAGHDLTYQAVAGALASTATMPALPVADVAGAWSAVAGILAALHERQRTGQGCHVDASLFDAGVHANVTGWAAEAGGRREVGEALPLSGALPCYNLYRTADGHPIALAALEPHFWYRLCNAVGRLDLVRRQYRSSPRARRQVESLVRSRTRDEWMEIFLREDSRAVAVHPPAAPRQHPQTRERGLVGDGPDGLPRLAFPARFDGVRPSTGGAVPALGQHTALVLEELEAPERALSPRQRGRAGIGPRFSWKSWLRRWTGR